MAETTILEKVKMILELSKECKYIILLLIINLVFIITTILLSKKNTKKYALFFIITLIAVIIINNYNEIQAIFNYTINNLFVTIYFPNIAIYVGTIIISNVILWTSIISNKTPKILKTINTIIFGIIQLILILVLKVIDIRNLDIFTQVNLYSNKETRTLIEISGILFAIWILFLLIYKAIIFLQNNNQKIEEHQHKDEEPQIIVKDIDNTEIKEINVLNEKLKETCNALEKANNQINEQNKIYEKNIGEVTRQLQDAQKTISVQSNQLQIQTTSIRKKEQQIIEKNKDLEKLNKELINKPDNKLKNKNSDPIIKYLDDVLTLEDYKLLSTILKEKQKKNKEQFSKTNTRNIEETKFSQIQEAYKSIR